MTGLVDIVNFNPDASCLGAGRWLQALEGGAESEACRWLRLYVELDKPVVLGLTGAAVADFAEWNPEVVRLIRGHPDIFGLLVRPYAHDIPLLRTEAGFRYNLRLGIAALRHEFGGCLPFYLPPEFMCNAMHIRVLAESGAVGVFINPGRFDAETAADIPVAPYRARGTGGRSVACVPVRAALTQAYLDSIHGFDAAPWQAALDEAPPRVVFAWRDGESIFLLPDSVARERAWLSGEGNARQRLLPKAVDVANGGPDLPYPVHPFSAWTKEMKMLWYLTEVRELEHRLEELSPLRRHLWLHATSSDILSSAEKRSPVVTLRRAAGAPPESFTIRRQPRFFEGEEYLDLARNADDRRIRDGLSAAREPHARRLARRLAYLAALDPPSGS